jgi:hypothetical protein
MHERRVSPIALRLGTGTRRPLEFRLVLIRFLDLIAPTLIDGCIICVPRCRCGRERVRHIHELDVIRQEELRVASIEHRGHGKE